MRRNLFYNCYARREIPEVWQDNIRTLCSYADAFNGRRIVVLKVDDTTAPPASVRPFFDALGDVEFIERPNDAVLHEASGFLETLEVLASARDDEATFYAHTKGAGKPNFDAMHHASIRQWRNRMYYECLSDPARIEAVLKDYASAGCYLRDWTAGDGFPWGYMGTFYWFRHRDLFSRPWRRLWQDRAGPECFLSGVIEKGEAHCLHQGRVRFYADVFDVKRCWCGDTVVRTERAECAACRGRFSVIRRASMYSGRNGEPVVLGSPPF